MKKVINNKIYDTETAELIAKYWNGLGCGDYRFLSERLYRTKKGNYFLHAEGGPLSEYCERIGNQRSGTSTIIAYDNDDAYNWMVKREFTEEVMKYFSDKIEEA